MIKDVQQILAGSEQYASERLITNIYAHDVDDNITKIIGCFWNKYKSFQINTGIYSRLITREKHDKNGHLLGFLPHILFKPFTNICTSFVNILLY